eukprot:COSAG02_NODE_455_length_21984_cov_4.049760_9_plen_95_part_00
MMCHSPTRARDIEIHGDYPRAQLPWEIAIPTVVLEIRAHIIQDALGENDVELKYNCTVIDTDLLVRKFGLNHIIRALETKTTVVSESAANLHKA